MSQTGQYPEGASNAEVESLTGNTGGAVGPDGALNINIVGSAPYTVSGNPGTNTLTITDDGTVATTFTEDSGSATPSSNNLTIAGGSGIDTSGAGSTVTITAADSVPLTFNEDSGSATPTGNALNVSGGNGIDTSGSGDTVTIAMGSSYSGSFTFSGNLTANTFLTSNLANGLTITSNRLTADGTNANIDIDLIPKGTGVVRVSTALEVDNVKVDGNVISTLDTDGNLSLTPDGSGTVNVTYATEDAIAVYGASGALSEVGPLDNGELVIGSTGASPVAATLSGGAGISVTNAAGSITIAATGSGFTWNNQGSSTTAATGNGYISTAAITMTLPAGSSLGDSISFIAGTSDQLTISAPGTDVLQFGSTASGAGGTADSTATGDSVELVSNGASPATWFAAGGMIGNWTIT